MQLSDRIHALSVLPARFNNMLKHALLAVNDPEQQQELCTVACVVSSATWQHWQAWKPAEDNRQEHEWVVFGTVMKIAEAEGLSLSEKRIATAFCFLHDTYYIRRIMEAEIRSLQNQGCYSAAAELTVRKTTQRAHHMKGGAENAAFLLRQLKHPDTADAALFVPEEVKRCVELVAQHDAWKIDPPEPPPTHDRLALACLEGDILWPLHPIGVLADLERQDQEGYTKDPCEPSRFAKQLQESLQTILEFRPKWKNVPSCDFIDEQSIFRTKEGHRLYSEWLALWRLSRD